MLLAQQIPDVDPIRKLRLLEEPANLPRIAYVHEAERTPHRIHGECRRSPALLVKCGQRREVHVGKCIAVAYQGATLYVGARIEDSVRHANIARIYAYNFPIRNVRPDKGPDRLGLMAHAKDNLLNSRCYEITQQMLKDGGSVQQDERLRKGVSSRTEPLAFATA
jgi:hypothetical protein